MKKQVTPKEVSVIAVYKFTKAARICFEVLSSDEITKYNTCFNGDAEHGSCNCDGHEQYHKDCYHIKGLRPRAQAYFDSRSEAEEETPGIDAAEQHINQLRQQVAASRQAQRAILAAPLNNQSHKMEVAPSGRLVPMR